MPVNPRCRDATSARPPPRNSAARHPRWLLVVGVGLLAGCAVPRPAPVTPPVALARPTHSAATPTRQSARAVTTLLNQAARDIDADQLDQAGAALERALGIDADDPEIWYRLAELRLRQGLPAQAIVMATRTTQLAGDDARLQRAVWLLLATAHTDNGEPDRAAIARQRAAAW